MDLETFQSLPTEEIARLVREAGTKVCAFPINGTRRWFTLEYVPERSHDPASDYLTVIVRRHVELYQLLFDHGLNTVLTPAFGPHQMMRGEEYVQMATKGLARLASLPDFLRFYEEYGVRVRFYGDHRKFFGSSPYAYLSDLFAEATARTRAHNRHRLFFGVFAHEAAETIAELAVGYYVEHGRIPDKRRLVELYYGEHVDSVDFFIGFSKLRAFDTPLLTTGTEDLYFTVSPSPYLTARQLRAILYDHLYARPGEQDYSAIGPDERTWMRDFYRTNLENTLGVGVKRGTIWYPVPQVEVPSDLADSPD